MQTLSEYKTQCKRCDRKRYIISKSQQFATALHCPSCFEVCPACQGSQYVFVKDEQGYRYASRCKVCGELDAKIQAYNQAKIPARYHHTDFSNFQVQLQSPGNARFAKEIGNLTKIRTQLYKWAQTFLDGDRGFLLYGTPGSGKTHLLSAVIRYLTLEKGIHARFIEFSHLLGEIREQYDHGKGDNTVLAPLIDTSVLAIDELGKGVNNEWQMSILDDLISKRYNQNKTTLFTTNYMLEEQAIQPTDMGMPEFTRSIVLGSLQERVGERIYSRLFEMTEFIHVDAPDYRKLYAQDF